MEDRTGSGASTHRKSTHGKSTHGKRGSRSRRSGGPGTCPMTRQQLVDEYFIENRTKILDIAAFLDRLERSSDGIGERDFRMQAFHEALQVLCSDMGSRATQVQMIFSDPTTEPLERLSRLRE